MGTFALRTLAGGRTSAVRRRAWSRPWRSARRRAAVRHVQTRSRRRASAVGIAAGCYGIAFVRRAAPGPANFLFYATLALLPTLRERALAGGPVLGIFWSVLGLAAAALGARFER
jgi:hypothetical protein